MRRFFEGGVYSSNYCNWQLKSSLHLGQIVITFRTLLHLGQNVITFRTLLHLGSFITFRPSTSGQPEQWICKNILEESMEWWKLPTQSIILATQLSQAFNAVHMSSTFVPSLAAAIIFRRIGSRKRYRKRGLHLLMDEKTSQGSGQFSEKKCKEEI